VQSLKIEKDAARAKFKESQKALQPLEEAHAAICTKKEQYDARYKTLEAKMKKSKTEMDEQHAKQEKHTEDLEETLTLLNLLDAEQHVAEKMVEKARGRLEQIVQEVADLPLKEQVDQAQAEAAADYRKMHPDFEKRNVNGILDKDLMM
jgi:chromosome segregation ATPase